MGHINLSIQQGGETKNYLFSNAEYLKESWLAEIGDDDHTKIVKQFQYKKFRDCFMELKRFISKLGTVKQISGSGIKPGDLAALQTLLLQNPDDRILPVNERAGKFEFGLFWNWLKYDQYLSI